MLDRRGFLKLAGLASASAMELPVKHLIGWSPDDRRPIIKKVHIPSGEAGTFKTLEAMAGLAKEASQDPEFVGWARAIARSAPSKDYMGELQNIYDFVQRNVTYRQDPLGMEWVQDPRWTMFVDGAGDCDDAASTVAALGMAVGHGAAFKIVKTDSRRPDSYSHVYPLLGMRTGRGVVWVPADTTNVTSGFLGWEPPAERVFGEKIFLVGSP
jgi:predicted transglutaminase-like cysteine proteinase